MNKQTFIGELKARLLALDVPDTDDILAEYEEHFTRKMQDGFPEEDVAKKLDSPAAIAEEYAAYTAAPAAKKAGVLRALLLLLGGFIVSALLAIGLVWAIVLYIAGLSLFVIGACLIAAPLFPEGMLVIPYLPYFSGVLVGVALIALGVLTSLLATYVLMLMLKIARSKYRRIAASFNGTRAVPYPVFPLFSPMVKVNIRRVALVSLAVFLLTFTAGYILMTVLAGAWEFWHEWNWFQYIS